MKTFTSLYDILQVPAAASIEEIKTAFRKLAKAYHPDKNDSSEARNAFILIHNAYRILSDPNLRKEYDFYFNSTSSRHKRRKSGTAGNYIGEPILNIFSLDEILSHINYFLWDIEIVLTKDFKKHFDEKFNGITVKEYILRMLIFIDKWILYPAGICDYFMQSRKMKDIDFSDYIRLIDDPANISEHRPFYSLDNYFYDVRKRIDKFINRIAIQDLYAFIPERNVRLIDCIIETQNYIMHGMGSLKRVLAGETDTIHPYVHSREIFER